MRLLIGLGFLALPFAVYLYAERLDLSVWVVLLGGLALARLSLLRDLDTRWLLAAAFGICGFCALSWWRGDLSVFKFYPVIVSTIGAAFFAYTLLNPPSAIERLMAMMGEAITAPAARYMRGVTGVWLIFFVVNASVAAWTALAASTAVWAWYNGFFSYVAMATLFGVEYLVRIWYRARV